MRGPTWKDIVGAPVEIHKPRPRFAPTPANGNLFEAAWAAEKAEKAKASSPFDIARYYAENGHVADPKAPNTSTLDASSGGRISVPILKAVVEAKTRKIAALWSHEAAQAAQGQADDELEAEIMAAIAQEITAEIDQELMVRSTDKPGTPTFEADISAFIGSVINARRPR